MWRQIPVLLLVCACALLARDIEAQVWLEPVVQADGSVALQHPCEGDAEPSVVIKEPRVVLRATALEMLRRAAEKNTSRFGRMRDELRVELKWLIALQDEHGRFALRDEPEWILDQGVATAALLELARDRNNALIQSAAANALQLLDEHLRRVRRVDGELLAWAALAIGSAKHGVSDATVLANAASLENAVADWYPRFVPITNRDRAALALLSSVPMLRGNGLWSRHSALDAALARTLVGPPPERWPAFAQDPLAVFFRGLALMRSCREPMCDPQWLAFRARMRAELFDIKELGEVDDSTIESALRCSRTESTRSLVHTVFFRMTGLALADV